MSSPYPVLGDRPIDQWRVTELKDELKKRKLMTKGLKEDLIKRLDEALRNEQEDLNKADSLGSVVQSEALPGIEMVEVTTSKKSEVTVTITNEGEIDLDAQISSEQESGSLIVGEGAVHATNHGDSGDEKVDRNIHNLHINDSRGSMEEQVREVQGVSVSDVTGLGGHQVAHVIAEKTTEMVSESMETVVTSKGEGLLDIGTQSESSDGKVQQDDNSKSVEALKGRELPDTGTQNESSDGKVSLDGGSLQSLHGDSKDILSDMNNQVSEANLVEGHQVKCESTSTETPLIIENNELNDNKFASSVKVELEVNPQMVPPLSGSDVSEGGKSPQVDVEQALANLVSVEETADGNAESVNASSKKGGVDVDLSFSGKVNMDQNSCDDFMDEDVAETKQTVVMADCEETRADAEKVEVSAFKDEVLVDIVGEEVSAERKASNAEEKNLSAMTLVKRKLNDQLPVGNPDVGKRLRRWNPIGLKVPEAQADDISSTPKDVVPQETTPKDVVQLPFKRSLSMSDSSVSEEVPKERVVPPSANPPTNSLRIDRFLRPFTLKAVQELLGKTGTVGSFWMDQIKTHCYVSYSSVDEAIETRNAVYNLQWPPNGGRLLVAEFVDPQEVKVRLEASLKAPAPAPAVPVKSGASVSHVGQNAQPLPSPRPHVPKQQLPQQALPPPPPTLPNPPLPKEQAPQPAREHIPVRERLTLLPPPPPPLAEKAEAPILTLDDLFRKTRATPRIYYLPLSDEQVAAKLQAQGKTVKQ